MHTIYLSIIIPAYNEEKRISLNLRKIKKYLDYKKVTYEIVVIIDGSPDNTAKVVEELKGDIDNLRVIENIENRGKGYVVRQGLMEAKGKYRAFLDADGSTSIDHIDLALEKITDKNNKYDLIVGSRDMRGANIAVKQPKYREAMGTLGNMLIRGVLGLWKYPDTQCGFKLITEELAQNVVPRMKVDRFGFDFELIVLAKKLDYRIIQIPVKWINKDGTTVGFWGPNGFIQVIIDLFKVRMRLWNDEYKIKNKKV